MVEVVLHTSNHLIHTISVRTPPHDSVFPCGIMTYPTAKCGAEVFNIERLEHILSMKANKQYESFEITFRKTKDRKHETFNRHSAKREQPVSQRPFFSTALLTNSKTSQLLYLFRRDYLIILPYCYRQQICNTNTYLNSEIIASDNYCISTRTVEAHGRRCQHPLVCSCAALQAGSVFCMNVAQSLWFIDSLLYSSNRNRSLAGIKWWRQKLNRTPVLSSLCCQCWIKWYKM